MTPTRDTKQAMCLPFGRSFRRRSGPRGLEMAAKAPLRLVVWKHAFVTCAWCIRTSILLSFSRVARFGSRMFAMAPTNTKYNRNVLQGLGRLGYKVASDVVKSRAKAHLWDHAGNPKESLSK